MMISAEYAAGFFDGEGSVYAGNRRQRHPIVMVCISNTHLAVLQEIKNRWGGALNERKGKRYSDPRWRKCWQLSMSPNNGRTFLADIYPFLIVKREVVSIALEYLAEVARPQKERRDYSNLVFRKGRLWTQPIARPEYLDRIRILHARIRELNAEGYNAMRQPSPIGAPWSA